MKQKIFLAIAAVAMAISANAQKVYEGTKFTDNWYIGWNVGGVTPTTHSAFFKDMRFTTGLEFGKQVTPILGLSFEAMTSINRTGSSTAFDGARLMALGKFNLNNWFAGYRGEPRLFEVEAVGGIGWGIDVMNRGYSDWDYCYMASKFGLNFNFNLGESKAWTVSVKPSLVYRMDGHQAYMLNVNKSSVELLAGVTYHFRNSNGKHYMTLANVCDPAEMDALNAKVNELRREAQEKEALLAAESARANDLQAQLDEANRKAVESMEKNTVSPAWEAIITFRQDEVVICENQHLLIERIASYMEKNEKATLTVKGYASPEGSAAVNTRVAQQRADAVKNMLVDKYNIDAARITAEGQGVGDVFSRPKWNRVSIATLNVGE